MALKRVEYQDKEGRKFLVELPEDYQDKPETGIVIGPPDLGEIGLPLELEVSLNNQLYDRKLFTPADVRRRPEEIGAALKAMLHTDVLRIRSLYGR